MIKALKRGLTGLATFSGRAPSSEFWPYASAVIAATFAALFLRMAPEFADTFDRMRRFAAEHPDQATVSQSATSYSISIEGAHPELMPDFTGLASSIALIAAVAVALLAAAVTRRLHDGGRNGFWGLLPLPFLTAGLLGMSLLFAKVMAPEGPPIPLFLALFANNVAYLASLALLVFFLAKRSDPGPNRFGEPPAP